EPPELRQELAAALMHQRTKLLVVIGEEQERSRGGELLSLKQHRRSRREQQQRGHRLEASGAGPPAQALAAARVRELVVVFDVVDEMRWRKPPGRRSTALRLPLVALPLVEAAVFDRRNELLRRACVIGVVSVVAAGERDGGGVMEVVVPQPVEPESA